MLDFVDVAVDRLGHCQVLELDFRQRSDNLPGVLGGLVGRRQCRVLGSGRRELGREVAGPTARNEDPAAELLI